MSRTLLFGVLVAVVLVSALPPAPAAAQMNEDIVFTTGRGSEVFEVWAVDGDGTNPESLIGGSPGSIEVDPAVTHAVDSAPISVAFARKSSTDETYDLMVKTLGSSEDAAKITDEDGTVSSDREPAWSPDLAAIAFTRMVRANDTSNIWTVTPDGTGLNQLTETVAPGYDASPAWARDGSNRIAFVSDRAGAIPQIFVMDGSGVTETQVTSEPCFAGSPSWSATSDVIFYERLCPGQPTGWDVYSIDLSAPVPTPVVATSAHERQPDVAPEGDAVVFTRYPAAGGDKELVTRDLASMAEAVVAGDPSADLSADWTQWPNVSTPRVAAEGGQVPSSEAARTMSAPKEKETKQQDIPKQVIKGVRYREMRKFKSDVYVLKVDASRIPRLDLALSNDLLPGHEKTKRMAKRHAAVAAINGDFGTPSGRPSHTFAEDGDLKQISFAVAPTFAMTQDEATTHVARPFETATAAEHDEWLVERWNFGAPGATEISAYTPAGGTLELPPGNACSARLQAVGGRRWAPGMAGVEVDYSVAEVGCATTAFGAPAPGQVVLSARPASDGGTLVGSLSAGETVTLTWSIGFAGVLDTVGGNPMLLENGVEVVPNPCTTSICKVHPRTAIGVAPTGRILMVVVDGRRKDSKGVTLVRLAKIMQGLHASFALNLDGGGSSTMVVRGRKGGLKVVNQPSDGSQRKVSSAVLILKGKDKGESIGAPLAPLVPAPVPGPGRAGEIAARDPASTGGLAEALAEGTFGPRLDLPPELRRALRIFRSARRP